MARSVAAVLGGVGPESGELAADDVAVFRPGLVVEGAIRRGLAAKRIRD